MARKPNVGLGIDRMYSTGQSPSKSDTLPDPIKLGQWQFGSYGTEEVHRRLRGDPCVPNALKDSVGKDGDQR